ncbi:MAG: hypothetical protein H6715_04985 [Myxococcales bacterium]|nr:hypothetical protein [Myxococcales bacterium]MCB9667455.1 hypothetical protein [Myxococcales bacterium]MCB9667459.1 hypothetical protein [Myxococcales bacterium]
MGRGVTGVEAAGSGLRLYGAGHAGAILAYTQSQVRALSVVRARLAGVVWVAHRGFVIGALGVLQTGDALA